MNNLKQRAKLMVMFILTALIPLVIVNSINALTATYNMRQVEQELLNKKLSADINAFRTYTTHYFGEIELASNELVSETGEKLQGKYDIIDQISLELGDVATIFIKENDQYKRVLTSIVDETTSKRIEGTLLDSEPVKLAINKGEDYIGSANILGKPYLTAYSPLKDSQGETIGILFVGISQQASQAMIQRNINEMFIQSFAILIVMILLGTVIMLLGAKQIADPLLRLVKLTNVLAAYNLTEDVPEKLRKRKDEIGILSRAIQEIAENLRQMTKGVGDVSAYVTSTSKELENNTIEATQATEEITKTVHEIAEGANQQAESTSDSLQRLEVLGELIDSNKEKMNQLNDASSQVSELAEVGRAIIETLTKMINESNEATIKAYENMKQTNQSANQISEASNLIASIAKQTNLLALNASIEAARAGEFGQGFSVVAEEIRKLAEQSALSTQMIDMQIKTLQQDASNAVMVTESVKEMLNNQTEKAHITEKKYLEIAEAIGVTQSVVQELNKSVKEMHHQKEEVSSHIDSLSAVAQENAAATQEALACIEEQNATLHDMQDSSANLAHMAENLFDMIKKFKV